MTLCIDEFKADANTGRMAIGVYDGDAARIVVVLSNMSREAFSCFLRRLHREAEGIVRFFACDMSREMVYVQQKRFPNAKLYNRQVPCHRVGKQGPLRHAEARAG